jgi:hypothetical protein
MPRHLCARALLVFNPAIHHCISLVLSSPHCIALIFSPILRYGVLVRALASLRRKGPRCLWDGPALNLCERFQACTSIPKKSVPPSVICSAIHSISCHDLYPLIQRASRPCMPNPVVLGRWSTDVIRNPGRIRDTGLHSSAKENICRAARICPRRRSEVITVLRGRMMTRKQKELASTEY